MPVLEAVLIGTFLASLAGILSVFVLYPLAVIARGRLCAEEARPDARAGTAPSVSLLVALRNAEALAEEKVHNSLALRAPGALQLVFVSDGSSDATAARLRSAGGGRVEVVEVLEHNGKAHALNLGAERCSGEILVLSDADALLAPDALLHLCAPFADERVGGVCGQRVLHESLDGLGSAQERYVSLDSALKRAESRLGRVTSNDGKLYAVRRALFRPIAPGATDDLWTCLTILEQGQRFVFEPRARAAIRTPSRGAAHELARRRRIVARSLHGLWQKRALLDPRRHGAFALGLFVNKVLRRCLPLFLLALFGSSLVLALRPGLGWARTALALQLAFYALALAHLPLARARIPGLSAAAATAYYFCVGNLGTLLGLGDFVRGREAVKWEPRKAG